MLRLLGSQTDRQVAAFMRGESAEVIEGSPRDVLRALANHVPDGFVVFAEPLPLTVWEVALLRRGNPITVIIARSDHCAAFSAAVRSFGLDQSISVRNGEVVPMLSRLKQGTVAFFFIQGAEEHCLQVYHAAKNSLTDDAILVFHARFTECMTAELMGDGWTFAATDCGWLLARRDPTEAKQFFS